MEIYGMTVSYKIVNSKIYHENILKFRLVSDC